MERYDVVNRQTFHIFEKPTHARPTSAPAVSRQHSHLQHTDITSHLRHQTGIKQQEKLYTNTIQHDKTSFHKKTSTNFNSMKKSNESFRDTSPTTPEHHFDTFTRVWHLSAQYLTHPFHKSERRLEEHRSGFYETFSSFHTSKNEEPYSTTLQPFSKRPHTAQPKLQRSKPVSTKARPRSAVVPTSPVAKLEDIHNPIHQMKEIEKFEHRLKVLFK